MVRELIAEGLTWKHRLSGIIGVIIGIIISLVGIIILFVVSWKVGLVFLGMGILIILLSLWSLKNSRKIAERQAGIKY
ncbi:MAG: hypothetical protein KKF56_00110 [Nanoarchaeota archaeon]|nr:hypothetical protein [Nanoarchaeota archaeon]